MFKIFLQNNLSGQRSREQECCSEHIVLNGCVCSRLCICQLHSCSAGVFHGVPAIWLVRCKHCVGDTSANAEWALQNGARRGNSNCDTLRSKVESTFTPATCLETALAVTLSEMWPLYREADNTGEGGSDTLVTRGTCISSTVTSKLHAVGQVVGLSILVSLNTRPRQILRSTRVPWIERKVNYNRHCIDYLVVRGRSVFRTKGSRTKGVHCAQCTHTHPRSCTPIHPPRVLLKVFLTAGHTLQHLQICTFLRALKNDRL